MENDDLDQIPPFNIEVFRSNPFLMAFLGELEGPVDSFRRMLYFDGAGSYLIPRHDAHAQSASQNIAEIIDRWFIEKLSQNDVSMMPILEESPQSAIDGILSKLRDSFVLRGLSNVLISIRAGHVYSLHMNGDEIELPQNYESFVKTFPLFVNVSVDVKNARHSSHNTCKILVVAERVTELGEVSFQLGEVMTSLNVTGNSAN
ncbi:10341_t:CDS:2 [Acaulospora colombiana]|uniref:10341_t:CDS:1 n=1 Tax=Acaulospora colombiana TaxID=27376 RepID=A0ACA9LN15_9GLOM|nr:10341_t:CDS:2 [Acaulospora colombiana]